VFDHVGFFALIRGYSEAMAQNTPRYLVRAN
jgi:hypothetical protein